MVTEDDAPFDEVSDDSADAAIAGPHGPLIRPVTLRHIVAGAALALLVEGLGRSFVDLPLVGLVLGLALLGSLGVKQGIAGVLRRASRPLPGLLWSEPLRLAADLTLFWLLLWLFSGILR